ncbi:hypothetical protein Vretifemale_665, partial [Volvox reticuliferus]
PLPWQPTQDSGIGMYDTYGNQDLGEAINPVMTNTNSVLTSGLMDPGPSYVKYSYPNAWPEQATFPEWESSEAIPKGPVCSVFDEQGRASALQPGTDLRLDPDVPDLDLSP